MKRVIITGDDFGLALPVNEAVAEAHARGVLTTASLMVGAGAAADAIERAKALPTLAVGLHVVLVEGRPLLPPHEIPDLVDSQGELPATPVRSGMRFFFRPGITRQLEAEIRAQFEAFRASGLRLDHVNAHNHMHLHPTVLSLILKVGASFGMKAARVPWEPPLPSWRASGRGLMPKLAGWLFLLPLLKLMRRKFRRQGIRFNDFIFGLTETGGMRLELVRSLLNHLPDGVTELYFHPATSRCRELDRTMPDYLHEEEFRTLTDDSIREALAAQGVQRISFSDL